MRDKINLDDFTVGLVNKDIVRVAMTPNNEYLAAFKLTDGEKYKLYLLDENETIYIINNIFYSQQGKFLSQSQLKKVIEILKSLAHMNPLKRDIYDRMYMEDEKTIVYDLNEECSIIIEPGNVDYCEVDEFTFRRGSNYRPQVDPELMTEPCQLFPLIRKHFNFESEDAEKLFCYYLVLAFKPDIRNFLLYLHAEKGSAKSTALKMIAKLISPNEGVVVGMPEDIKDLKLRLAHSSFVGLDNVSNISTRVSDLFCRAISEQKAQVPIRKLFTTAEEMFLDVSCTIALNSVDFLFRRSDVCDRTMKLSLTRIESKKIKTEKEVWEEFDKDIPYFLGAIFNILAEVLKDDEEVEENTRLVRMAGFHKEAIKVGRVLGISGKETTRLLWYNQNSISYELMMEDEVMLCVIKYFKYQNEFKGSVTAFLNVLKEVADAEGIDSYLLPSRSADLSKKLNSLKSNLQQVGRIKYDIKKRQMYKEIYIRKMD